ncbi:hypothetical protein IPZ58_28040 [Streptomyces roseoverticillatus]|uniref:hypothetical protein n=1 Tax=Streptomyces roseoverticillatus TaxID=66429 RepID=UPI001F36A4BB|nr:hypothetical protein [Streptomyces roseoverticillatus]MCF3105412.1 hypothetical protein [Streptomyces roseoverticillatus]
MFKKLRERQIRLQAGQRHTRLMGVAEDLVREAGMKQALTQTTSPQEVTLAEVACLAFARYQLRIDEAEAADYLAAALVARGYSTDHWPAASA